MTVYGPGMERVDNPDLSLGRIEINEVQISHVWVVDAEEVTHEEVVAEYPKTGGKDVAIVIDSPETGHWETFDTDGNELVSYDGPLPDWAPAGEPIDAIWSCETYVPYTQAELDEIARRESERQAAQAAEAEREQWLQSAPSQLADMDELLVALYESQLETDELLVTLYEGGM